MDLGDNMDACDTNLAISALACAIAKGKTTEQLALLSALFVQLGDSLATIATVDAANEAKKERSE